MIEKLIDALQKDGFDIEQTVLSGKDAILHLSSSLTKEEENTFKEIIVTLLL
ncbi:hypothetical protein LNQ52_19965 [Klebsiella pneumoniae subsp. pneumoniae]|nr:hypothetical protein [Klebsiella pneumoniae subsp. pneumoniae]